MYAVFVSLGAASICCRRPHSGRLGIFLVTFVQFCPPSCVTCTTPSSVPTQIVFGSTGEIEIDRIAPNVSAPLRSRKIGRPLLCCLLLSLRVRSGLIGVQFLPPSVERNSTFPPRYTSFGFVMDTAIGDVQLKRYLSSEGFIDCTPCRYGLMKFDMPVSLCNR